MAAFLPWDACEWDGITLLAGRNEAVNPAIPSSKGQCCSVGRKGVLGGVSALFAAQSLSEACFLQLVEADTSLHRILAGVKRDNIPAILFLDYYFLPYCLFSKKTKLNNKT